MLIVYAHQEPKSFNGSLKEVAVEELGSQGCNVTVSDLYAMDFEPRATRKDITGESWDIRPVLFKTAFLVRARFYVFIEVSLT